jgi:hypothetical protein
VDPDEVVSIPQAEAAERASAAFKSVFENGTRIELDHYVVYFSRKCSRFRSFLYLMRTISAALVDYEYGRLLACTGDKEGARVQLDLVLSGKPLEVNNAGRKVRTVHSPRPEQR